MSPIPDRNFIDLEILDRIHATEKAEDLKSMFKAAYLEHETLADATRYLANELFGEYGLVVLDGDDTLLKRDLLPYARKDICDNLGHRAVADTISRLRELDTGYDIQVNPREINYFYIKEGMRERIEAKNGDFFVLNSTLKFSKSELEEELRNHPERFSPNVIARPLYQEVVLPNLCYIGGGAEVAYWLQLKDMFEAMEVPFPAVMLRNSVLLVTEKQGRKLKKLGVEVKDLFLKQHTLINKKVREISNIDIDFTPQREHLKAQFEAMYELAQKTDKSFLGAVKAQEVKQLKGLDHLEKRLLKAQKRKLQDQVVRLATRPLLAGSEPHHPQGGLGAVASYFGEFDQAR